MYSRQMKAAEAIQLAEDLGNHTTGGPRYYYDRAVSEDPEGLLVTSSVVIISIRLALKKRAKTTSTRRL